MYRLLQDPFYFHIGEIVDSNFPRALQLVLKHEGGFVNHLSDLGGAISKEITPATFRLYIASSTSMADLK
ncbi:glycosyl hydrolase 108 family protein [Hoeflea sp. TYP-13]|uniref:glycosyl hydrolase 108 family protein n=1 Tax=Hoeflea sp. TYP-13 TaxID=3230023 RepID=UPI0034C658DC